MSAAAWHRDMARWGRSRGRSLTLCTRIPSTHRMAVARLAVEPAPEPPGWIFAFEQTRGEGRLGRGWASPPGAGVYASCLLATPRDLAARLPLAVGVALCEALARLDAPCRLKWPNDLLLDGRKVGGILLQSRGGRGALAVVTSFGVNLSHRRDQLPQDSATSLRLAGGGRGLTLAALSAALAESLEVRLAALLAGAAEEILARYRELSAHRMGEILTVASGHEGLTGRFGGFAADGRLRLMTDAGERLVSVGEVSS